MEQSGPGSSSKIGKPHPWAMVEGWEGGKTPTHGLPNMGIVTSCLGFRLIGELEVLRKSVSESQLLRAEVGSASLPGSAQCHTVLVQRPQRRVSRRSGWPRVGCTDLLALQSSPVCKVSSPQAGGETSVCHEGQS